MQWQPDGLTIQTKKWFLGAGFLRAPLISLIPQDGIADHSGDPRSYREPSGCRPLKTLIMITTQIMILLIMIMTTTIMIILIMIIITIMTILIIIIMNILMILIIIIAIASVANPELANLSDAAPGWKSGTAVKHVPPNVISAAPGSGSICRDRFVDRPAAESNRYAYSNRIDMHIMIFDIDIVESNMHIVLLESNRYSYSAEGSVENSTGHLRLSDTGCTVS